MNPAVDLNGLRSRDGYPNDDQSGGGIIGSSTSVTSILHGALGYSVHSQQQQQQHPTDHINGASSASSMGRSHSSSSSSGGSGGGAGSGDHATPPALQTPQSAGQSAAAAASMANHHQLQAQLQAHQMALSHYNPSSMGFGSLAFSMRPGGGAGGGIGGGAPGHGQATAQSIAGNLRRYPCKLCPAMFDSKAELQIHTQVHMREAKPYKCSHCVKSFANSSYLSQHMRIHLNIKPFGPCQYCGRKFTQLSHLQQHLRTHTGEKPYKCRHPGCEKAFSQLSNLQSHSRCHQADKPYKCNSCYKCFDNEPSLLEHIPKHKESKHLKVHICPYCGKSYTQATYLAKHMTKHSDRKPVKASNHHHSASSVAGAVTTSTSMAVAAAAVAAAAAASQNGGVTNGSVGGGGAGGGANLGSVGGAGGVSDMDHLWGTGGGGSVSNNRTDAHQSLCPIHGIVDTCHADSAQAAISFNSFPAHNHIMQQQTCAYTPTGIANSMANMAAAAAVADQSAFTRLAGLAPLSAHARSLTTGSSRNPYNFSYDNFKAAAAGHSSGLTHPSAQYNQLIRLDDIRNYAGQAAAAEHFSSMLQIKRDPREAAY